MFYVHLLNEDSSQFAEQVRVSCRLIDVPLDEENRPRIGNSDGTEPDNPYGQPWASVLSNAGAPTS